MLLLEEQVEHFHREGYVVAPGLVPLESVRAVLEAAPKEVNREGRWQPHIFEHAHPEKDWQVHRLLVEPRIVEAVTDIFGAPPRVYYGMLAIVPAHGGNGLPWHQDNQYNQILGGALNVFVALSEITPDRAILWVAPRSHHAGVQPCQANTTTAPGHREAVVEPENGIPLPTMKPGDVCILDRSAYHRSLRNETGEDRFAYAAQYQSDHARQALTGKRDPAKMLASELREEWLREGLDRSAGGGA